jgi:tetratricopeptide (TPR) repeat protein
MRGIVPALNAFLVLLFAGPDARAEARPPVHAEQGSVGIGGNVTDSTIINGVPAEKVEELIRLRTKDLNDLTEAQRENNAQLKKALNLTEGQVKHALEIVGEADIPPERVEAELVEIAAKFKELQLAAGAQPGDNVKITAMKGDAQKAIQNGELGKADEILTAIEKMQDLEISRLALNAAQTTAQRGDVALTQLHYRDAAQRFAEAATKVPPGYEEERWRYLNKEADAFLKQGFEFGDNGAVLRAIERYRALVELRPQNAFPRDWARAHIGLGDALLVLGQRELGKGRLEEAVAAYREALQENTRRGAPFDWALTQNELGFALLRLGQRERETARLEEAAAAFRNTLEEWTRQRAPRKWAGAQKNLALALIALGRLEHRTAHIQEAVDILRDALQESTRAEAPFQWAFIQNTLGGALMSLGELEPGTTRLEEAVIAFREALHVQTRERLPVQWAMSTGAQGVALMLLAKRRGDVEMAKTATQQIEEAIMTFRDAGDANSVTFYEARLLHARAIVDQLAGR